MENVKRTLREWRAFLKLNKQEMARMLGIHPATYSKWEDKPEEIRVCDVVKIANVLKCDVSEIIFFEKEPSFKLGNFKSVS